MIATNPIAVNLNDTCAVRLTRAGITQFYRWHEALGIISDGPKIDAEGWYRAPFWELMQIFGPITGQGFNPPFETDFRIKPQ